MSKMVTRVLVTGSQLWPYRNVVEDALRSTKHWIEGNGNGMVVGHGACEDGADLFAAAWCAWAEIEQAPYPITPEQWRYSGRLAGPARNLYMVDHFRPDLCLAFHYDWSPGTRGCLDMCRERDIAWARYTATSNLPGIVGYQDMNNVKIQYRPAILGGAPIHARS